MRCSKPNSEENSNIRLILTKLWLGTFLKYEEIENNEVKPL
jgi:hypothetical protein